MGSQRIKRLRGTKLALFQLFSCRFHQRFNLMIRGRIWVGKSLLHRSSSISHLHSHGCLYRSSLSYGRNRGRALQLSSVPCNASSFYSARILPARKAPGWLFEHPLLPFSVTSVIVDIYDAIRIIKVIVLQKAELLHANCQGGF